MYKGAVVVDLDGTLLNDDKKSEKKTLNYCICARKKIFVA